MKAVAGSQEGEPRRNDEGSGGFGPLTRTMFLFFLLDPQNISPSLFRDLKQLVNMYAASTVGGERAWQIEVTSPLPDRIGLCYIHGNGSSSSSSELKVAYKTEGSFSLRDFHRAVNSLPMSFLIESIEQSIRRILSEEFLYMWNPEDTPKKMIVVTSCAFTSSEPLQKIILDAATRSMTIELVVLEEEVMSQKTRGFIYDRPTSKLCYP